MTKFTDRHGKTWLATLTIGSARKVKVLTGLDLLNPLQKNDGKTALEVLAENPALIADIMYVLCDAQDADAFADCFDGEAITRALDCFMEELENFSRPATRALIAKVWTATREAEMKVADDVTAVPDAEMRKALSGASLA